MIVIQVHTHINNQHQEFSDKLNHVSDVVTQACQISTRNNVVTANKYLLMSRIAIHLLL